MSLSPPEGCIDMLGLAKDFKMPEIWVGTEVEVSIDPTMPKADWGIIVTPKQMSADIFFAGTGQGYWRRGYLEDCWHIDDPRVVSNPAIIGMEENRGVWRLSKREQIMRATGGKIAALEASLNALFQQIKDVNLSIEKAMNGKVISELLGRVQAIEKEMAKAKAK